MTIPTPTEIKPADFRKEINLLVVDDSDDHYEQLCEYAGMYSPEFSVECHRAESTTGVIDVPDGSVATVVLLDIHVLSDALQLITQLTHKGIPVVATSSSRFPNVVETTQQYGAVGYFSKSDNPDDVEALLLFAASVAVAPHTDQ